MAHLKRIEERNDNDNHDKHDYANDKKSKNMNDDDLNSIIDENDDDLHIMIMMLRVIMTFMII